MSSLLFSYLPFAVPDTYTPRGWQSGHFCVVNVPVILPSSLSELIRTVDGGQISLDWVDNQTSGPYPESSTRPTVLILPGLTGNSQQSYVLHAISQATRHGYRSVVLLTRLSSHTNVTERNLF